jgi:Ca2+-binding RTX toxin-like protein
VQLLAGATDPEGDTLSVSNLVASSGSLVDNGNGTWTFTPASGDDTGVSFSYVVSDGTDTVAGSASLDLLPIADGPTSEGDDLVLATADLDYLDGLGGTDTLDMAGVGLRGVWADLLFGLAASTPFGLQVVVNFENLLGSAGNDLLSGDDDANLLAGRNGNDSLSGRGGNDTLDGGAGSDLMAGGAGNDLYLVDRTADRIQEGIAAGIDTVLSSVSLTLASNVENLILAEGSAARNAIGTNAANTLQGNSAANRLEGRNGNDVLIGAGGNDSLIGGNGSDAFVFSPGSGGIATVTDFNELNGGGEEGDVLRITETAVGAFAYRGTAAFTGGGDNSEARISGNLVLIDIDGNATTDLTLRLTGLTRATQLSAGDFVFG